MIDKEIIYIIVCSLSYFVGYYIRGLHDNAIFYKISGLSLNECADIIEEEMTRMKEMMPDIKEMMAKKTDDDDKNK